MMSLWLLLALNAARASDRGRPIKHARFAVYITSARDKDWSGNLLGNGIALGPGATRQSRSVREVLDAKISLVQIKSPRRTPMGRSGPWSNSTRPGFCVEILYLEDLLSVRLSER